MLSDGLPKAGWDAERLQRARQQQKKAFREGIAARWIVEALSLRETWLSCDCTVDNCDYLTKFYLARNMGMDDLAFSHIASRSYGRFWAAKNGRQKCTVF